jgi:diguanylate cyclase (GGDEF)-like protein
MLNISFIFICISLYILIYILAIQILNLAKNPLGKNKVPFSILSVNIFLLSLGSFVLLTSSDMLMLNVWANIIVVAILTLPAIIFHFSLRFTGNEISKTYKICLVSFYSLSLILSGSLMIFNQVGIQEISYGYTIKAPLLIFAQLFFITPINLFSIFIISQKIYKNMKSQKSILAVSLLLIGFTYSFLGETVLNYFIENGTIQPLPLTWASSILLYFFISLGFLISNFSLWRITQDRIFRSMEDAVLAFDNSGQVVEINKSAYAIMDLDEKKYKKEKLNIEYISDNLSSRISDKRRRKNFAEKLADIKLNNYKEDIEFRINGGKKHYNVKMSPIVGTFNRVIGKVLILANITSIKEKEMQLYYQSYHDKLTGIYNRLYFEEELTRLDTKRQFPISIIIGDVNGLKLINDAYGHNKGDEVLKKIAEIFKNNLRHEDILCRWGGDEFATILPRTQKEDSVKIIDRVKESCIRNSTESMPLNISMGFAVKNSSSKKINEIVKEAEDIMNEHKLLENESARSSIILSLKKALEERYYETEEHAMRMANLSLLIGERINLKYNELNELRLLAILHDIGKISISDSIILKPGRLTSDEWEIIKKHPEVGYRLAKSSRDLGQIAKGILYHHERWDGNGYPEGLKGKKIPVISRIVSIADAFDAMTNDRPYRKAMTKYEAIEEIKKESGSQFDPYLAKLFMEVLAGKNIFEVDA